MIIKVTNVLGKKKETMVIFQMELWSMLIHFYLERGATFHGIKNLRVFVDDVEVPRPVTMDMED